MKRKILSIIALLAVMVALTGAASAINVEWQKNGVRDDPLFIRNGQNVLLDMFITALRPQDNGTNVNFTVTFSQCTNSSLIPFVNCDFTDVNAIAQLQNFTITFPSNNPVFLRPNLLLVTMHAPLSREPGSQYSFDGFLGPFPPPAENPAAGITVILQGANITGMKFNDLNNNSAKDPGEPGLAGWTINLKNQSTGAVIATTTTDSNGNYNFTNLRGNFTVEEVLKSGWTQTFPASKTYNVTVDAVDVANRDFGNNQNLSISGMKFNDLNNNSAKDPGEPGLGGWQIDLNFTNGTVFRTTTTASDGSYKFQNVPPGTYIVQEVQQTGWNQTFPTPVPPGTYTVTLTNVSVTGLDFGNHRVEEGHPGKCIGWGNLKNPSAKFNIFAFTPNKFSGPQGTVEFEQGSISIKSTQIDSVNSSADKTSCSITGLASVNGSSTPVSFRVDIEDRPSGDMFGIDMRPGDPFFRPKEVLSSGNLKIIK